MLDVFVWFLTLLLTVSAMILPMALICAIVIPFIGVLVRYRANYTPKRLQGLDQEGLSPESAPNVGYFRMMKKVHRIEGWPGFFKGIMPYLIGNFIVVVLVSPVAVFLSLGSRVLPNGQVYIPAQTGVVMWIWTFALSLIPTVLLIPVQILTNRAITTPHKLSFLAPRDALRILLSPSERAGPLRLYLAPGLLATRIIEGLLGPFISVLHQVVTIHLPLGFAHRLPFLAASFSIVLGATIFLTPLRMIFTRLTLQRADAAVEDAGVQDEVYGEPVVELRGVDEAPYTGLVDCAKQIVREEGWRVLFRAWWVTVLGMMLPLLVPLLMPTTDA
ncbi:mitochondrial carrier domain-containing protein [Roridomyces roridus]|uniref:Mitochondrial carrier domain-containing protein n=1 Tax=Roridomyces roridus TaxID=1738132 RepID=A0AAD7B2M3_9AGAR|nr:mitochondrial carrier domain-containing protein [Roridomyces roridus]